MRQRPVVAVDGPSGVGKSTVARALAARLGFFYVDTGALYRTMALVALRRGVSWDDGLRVAGLARESDLTFSPDGRLQLDGQPVGDAIRTPEISTGASTVARHPEVRAVLLEVQRRVGQGGGVVLDGRDIGTVVFPDAEVKIFLNASPAIRAERRHRELLAKGTSVAFDDVLAEQERRDAADRGRAVSPLVAAPDAVEVSTDGLGIDEVVKRLSEIVSNRFPLTPPERME